jgi:putative FmdB family regulatory protein
MTSYAYRCAMCGPFDIDLPMGTAPRALPCPRCEADASRVYTPPMLARTSGPLARALAAEEKSADYPDVSTRVPTRRRPASPPDPRWAGLPKV